MERVLNVLCVHGEGDRATVNQLRKNVLVASAAASAEQRAAAMSAQPDEPADVIVVMRDAEHGLRIELPLTDWNDVEHWKELVGYDADRRQWQSGAEIKVSFARAEAPGE